MRGEVTHFALLDTLAASTGKPRGRTGGRRRHVALCAEIKESTITTAHHFIEITLFIYVMHFDTWAVSNQM